MLFLTACGGGGTLGGEESDTGSYKIELVLTGGEANTDSVPRTSADNPLMASVTLTRNNAPLINEVVTFTTSGLGTVSPASGTAATNSTGLASVNLLPGTTAGAGTLTASYTIPDGETITTDINFESIIVDTVDTGDYSLELQMFNTAGAELTTSAERVTSESNKITVVATLTEGGEPVENSIISFSTELTGALVPAAGNIATDNEGKATITLNPGTQEGAGRVIATISIDDITLNQNAVFTSVIETVNQTNVVVTAKLYSCPTTGWVLADGFTNCIESNKVLGDEKSYVEILVTENLQPVANAVVNLSSTGGSVTFSPFIGELLTNTSGKAIFEVTGNATNSTETLTATYGSINTNLPADVSQFSKRLSSTLNRCPAAWVAANDPTLSTCVISDNIIVGDAEHYVLKASLTNLRDSMPAANFSIDISSGLNNQRVVTNASGIALFELGEPGGDETFTVSVDNIVGLNSTIDYVADLGNEPEVLTLSLKLFQAVDVGDPVTEISDLSVNESRNGVLIATLVNGSGEAVVNRVINFTTSLGEIFPASGTALTNDLGEARLDISPGIVKGAGTATAAYQDKTASVSFSSQGDEAVDENPVDITLTLYGCTITDPSNIPATCSSTSNISLTSPGSLVIKVTRENSTEAVSNILVSSSTSIGTLSPTNGTVLTNSDGLAVLRVLAGEGSGAGAVSVAANGKTQNANFEIGAARIAMGRMDGATFVADQIDTGLGANEKLAVNSTAILKVSVINQDDNDNLYQDPITVTFSSSCASETPPRAVIDNEVTAVAGQATAVYRSDGCPGIDIISASASAGSVSLNATAQIDNAEAATTSIEFESISVDGDAGARIITFPGTGRTEQADVIFKALDSGNNPAAAEKLCFALTTDVGGISISPSSAFTLTDGTAKVVVKGGSVPTPVRVIASLAKSDGTCADDSTETSLRVRSVSDILTVSTGLADSNSITLSVETLNPEAWNINNQEDNVTVRLSDHYNNPVPDGTAVTFVTEGADIDPSCVTSDGACSVVWTSSNPRPGGDTGLAGNSLANGICDTNFNGFADAGEPAANNKPCVVNGSSVPLAHPRAGRVTILAYAVGEESFVDSNGDGFYTGAEPFIDADGDQVYDAGESFTDLDGNGVYTASEKFDDLDEAFLDHNLDGYFCGRLDDSTNVTAAPGAETDASLCRLGGDDEEFVDYNSNQTFDKKDGVFSGILCSESEQARGVCSRNLVHIRDQSEIVMSGSSASFIAIQNNVEISSVDLTTATGSSSATFTVYITDVNNNPMPAGTTVTLETANGELVGGTSYTFPNTSTARPIGFSVSVKREEEANGVGSAPLTITVTSPSGVQSAIQVTVVDNG
ncbi:hypothetical protein [Algibacillus agarilyticus]|uniref:hypothetical protein n=1 Tax=Algibacillus agarilyticus TaxID=2234133 RepID=UPI000DD0EDD7|nr:hypothetical protein [Algibacillus agarilyticus]